MTLTRVLAELKTLDARIEKSISNNRWLSFTIGSGKKPAELSFINKSIDEIGTRLKSDQQSTDDLIARRIALKSALLKANSNVDNVVTIGGKDMTIAEAIDFKNIVALKEKKLAHMKARANAVKGEVERRRMQVDEQIDAQATQLAGSDKAKIDESSLNAISTTIRAQFEPELFDPLKIDDAIEALSKEIDDFKLEIDFVLSEANTKFTVEIPD
jgi:hypothetical protein